MTKNIKILITPANVASMPSFLVEALNQLENTEAVGLFLGENKYVYKSTSGHCRYIPAPPRSKLIPFILSRIKFAYLTIKYILWADVVHIVWDNFLPFHLDLKLCRWLNKTRFVEWVGSEIRIPKIAMEISPYAKLAYDNDHYEYAQLESEEQSMGLQKKFSHYGFIPLTYSELDFHISKTLFPKRYFTNQRLPVFQNTPNYPSIEQDRPLIVHSPTASIAKGSTYIIKAMEELQSQYSFTFKLITNVSREEALNYMKECDLFIDQLILGAHGLATCEALSLGKPVICYLSDAVSHNHFPTTDCPIVIATVDNLKEILIPLITNARLRQEIGYKSRQYAETYHDALVVAQEARRIYQLELDHHS